MAATLRVAMRQIPKGESAKMEMTREEAGNPVFQDRKSMKKLAGAG